MKTTSTTTEKKTYIQKRCKSLGIKTEILLSFLMSKEIERKGIHGKKEREKITVYCCP